MKKRNNEFWLIVAVCISIGIGTALLISGLVQCNDTVANLGLLVWLLTIGAELLVLAIENRKNNLKQ